MQKAGCFALVKPDGSVEALWPGISSQGFRDLAGRLGVEPPLPETLLAEVSGAAVAGCPLNYGTTIQRGGRRLAPDSLFTTGTSR